MSSWSRPASRSPRWRRGSTSPAAAAEICATNGPATIRRPISASPSRTSQTCSACSARIRAEHAEQVWEVRDGEAEIGRRIVAGPFVAQISAAAAGDVEPRRHLGDLEAGRDHDDIERPLPSVNRQDAVMREAVDPVADEFYVRPGQRLEPAIVEQYALAIGRVGRQAFL